MKKVFAVTAALVLLCLGIAAQANVFNLGAGFTNLETVFVGDRGNDPDTRYANPGYGSVGYNYNIGKYEVTAKQYTDFLNAKAKTDTYGLYNSQMSDPTFIGPTWSLGCNIQRSGGGTVADPYIYTVAHDWANRPVNHVSYWDACRFANWLGNGQGNGDTETGAYTQNGYNGNDGRTIKRNPGSTWVVTSEDEWYKAAYYKGGGTKAGYWDYPMQSDISTIPSNVITNPDGGNNANFYEAGSTIFGSIGSPYYRTNVGEFENSGSAYGTFDQCGNVFEWNEAIVYQDANNTDRGLRGGSFDDDGHFLQASARYDGGYPACEASHFGFRVAYVPEPSSIITLAGGLIGLLGIRRRRA